MFFERYDKAQRAEPFGFKIKELPTEINYINATHIYCSELSKFDESILFDFLVTHA